MKLPYDGLSLGANADLGAYGGGNIIVGGAGDHITVGQTSGIGDALYVNGDQFGGTTADGQATGTLSIPVPWPTSAAAAMG